MEFYGEKPVTIEGKKYWTINQFAKLVGKHRECINNKRFHGNLIRKLKCERIAEKPFIPYEELFDYPWVVRGRPHSAGIYATKFKPDGKGGLVKTEQVIEK